MSIDFYEVFGIIESDIFVQLSDSAIEYIAERIIGENSITTDYKECLRLLDMELNENEWYDCAGLAAYIDEIAQEVSNIDNISDNIFDDLMITGMTVVTLEGTTGIGLYLER